MKSNMSATVIAALLGSLVLIVKNDIAIKGAVDGIKLCYNTVIPSLFPFIFITNIIISSPLSGNRGLIKAIGSIFSIPQNCEDLLIPILFGGYPLGVIAVVRAYKEQRISKENANRLLLYCNNPGPAFILGIMSKVFHSKTVPFQLWFIQILCCLTLSFLYPSCESGIQVKKQKTALSEVMQQSLQSVSIICGWVILFKIIISLLPNYQHFGMKSSFYLATIGCIELTNGCIALSILPNGGMKFVIASTLLGLGGICVAMQSISLSEGLCKKNYYIGKCMNGILAFGYSTIFSLAPAKMAYIITTLPMIILKISKRKSRFYGMIRV